jgi:hypothetical protein
MSTFSFTTTRGAGDNNGATLNRSSSRPSPGPTRHSAQFSSKSRVDEILESRKLRESYYFYSPASSPNLLQNNGNNMPIPATYSVLAPSGSSKSNRVNAVSLGLDGKFYYQADNSPSLKDNPQLNPTPTPVRKLSNSNIRGISGSLNQEPRYDNILAIIKRIYKVSLFSSPPFLFFPHFNCT